MSSRNSVATFGPATAETAWYTSSMKKRKESDGPLQGLLVVDFTRVLAGPLCTQLLSDAGARVIKIEEPGRGDETRRWGPPFVKAVSTYFLSVNRGKESLAIDLKSPRSARVVRRLLSRADVVVDNFLPSQKESLRFVDPRAVNPRIVHCTISGFDSDTTEANTPGYDLLAQAASGLMAITGEPRGEPMKVGVALLDVLTGHYAFGAICAALYARERTGEGASIEVSLFASALASLVNVAQGVLLMRKEAQRYGNEHPSIVPYQLFHGSDRPFVVGVGTDRHFQLLCTRVLDRPRLADDRRFATNAQRVKHRRSLLRILGKEFREAPASRWVARCRKYAIPASPVRGVREALGTSAGRALIGSVDHPSIGRYEAVRYPVRFNGHRRPLGSAPPSLGEHTEAILAELGVTE